jgi:hypothetical protein
VNGGDGESRSTWKLMLRSEKKKRNYFFLKNTKRHRLDIKKKKMVTQ